MDTENSTFPLGLLPNPSGAQCKDIDNCRTLSTIILTCLTSLIAATWVSVHPNIPAPRVGFVMLALHRLKLMALAIIAPEVVAVWALRQRMVARLLSSSEPL